MTKSNKQLYASLVVLTILMTALLVREINNYKRIATEQATEPLISDNTTPLPDGDPRLILGNKGAPLTIVEYMNLGNNRSKEVHQQLVSFVRKQPLKARLVLKNAPVSHFFSDPTLAHKAAYCAAKQNCSRSKNEAPEPCVWSFLDSIIGNNYSLRESGLRKAAAETSMKIDAWWICVNDPATEIAVQKDLSEAVSLQAGEPPLIYLNNRKLNVMHDLDLDNLLTSLIQP